MVRQRVLAGPLQLVPAGVARRADRWLGSELVHAVAGGAAFGRDGTGQHVEEEQAAGHLPAAEVAGAGRPPVVRREPGRMGADQLRDLPDRRRVDAGLVLGRLRGVLRVLVEERGAHRRPLDRQVGSRRAQVGLPVGPPPHERLVPCPVGDQEAGDRQQQVGLRTGPRRQPVVGLAARVRQARIDADDLRPALLRLDDPLRVGVEVVTRFEVGGDEEDDLRVGEVRRRAIVAHPRLVADARVGRADVGVAVVAVDTPRLEHAVGVAVLAGTTDVVHDLVVAVLDDRLAQPGADLVEGLAPADPLPPAGAAGAHALHREQDPLGVVHLIERRRTLGAVPAAAPRVLRVALDLGDLAGRLVEIGDETAARLAVEARGRDHRVVALHPVRPRLGVELGPVVPTIVGRVLVQIGHRRLPTVEDGRSPAVGVVARTTDRDRPQPNGRAPAEDERAGSRSRAEPPSGAMRVMTAARTGRRGRRRSRTGTSRRSRSHRRARPDRAS